MFEVLNEYFNCEEDIKLCMASEKIHQEVYKDQADDIITQCAKISYVENKEGGLDLSSKACIVSDWCDHAIVNGKGEFVITCSTGGYRFTYYEAAGVAGVAALVVLGLFCKLIKVRGGNKEAIIQTVGEAK